ncbi:hypothetical protein like AT1G52565 [Hibiscus trionum]|uniref:Uncharacterized protein n=1 Tax=Hibiscus trionum TaxID=183268 RepID=A0A9W7MC12_HIBTR|nr:hypothetical protein like AT1G52565 [Hibiscus trionum]
MASILSSQAMVFATAMAVSGTAILLVFRLQPQKPSQQALRSCISSEGKKKKTKKKVQFAEDVMDPGGEGEELRLRMKNPVGIFGTDSSSSSKLNKIGAGMPANRAALYNGILRDRGVQRLAYSC